MQINPQKLIALRKSRNLTAEALAFEAKIGRATITRIENGHTSSSSSNTVKKLAEVLCCRPEELFSPPETVNVGPLRQRWAASFEMSPNCQNALWLIARRYKERAETILELAPLLFDLIARESMIERRRNLDELRGHRQALEAMANRFPHLGERFTTDWDADQYIANEESSIRQEDLRGDLVHRDHPDVFGFYPDEFDEESDNPFVVHLRNRCKRVANEGYEDAQLDVISRWGGPVYQLGIEEAKAVVGGDEELALALVQGDVLISKIPKELGKADRLADRQEWLRQKAAEYASAANPLLDDLGI